MSHCVVVVYIGDHYWLTFCFRFI